MSKNVRVENIFLGVMPLMVAVNDVDNEKDLDKHMFYAMMVYTILQSYLWWNRCCRETLSTNVTRFCESLMRLMHVV